jgi:hypothetical protein
MRYLVMMFAILALALVGCSDDDKPVDAGTDAVMEASVDAAPGEASVDDAAPGEKVVDDAAPVVEASVDAAPDDAAPGE